MRFSIFILLFPIIILALENFERFKDISVPKVIHSIYTKEFRLKSEFKPFTNDFTHLFLVDADSNKVLFGFNEFDVAEIASVTKMMPMLLVAEALERGDISLSDTLVATTKSSKIGGSQIYLKEHERMTVDELFKSVVMKSANDATFLLGQKLTDNDRIGDFVDIMNKRAAEIGMNRTVYYYPHGLPSDYQDRKNYGVKGNLSTCYDLTLLAKELIKYPIVLKYSSTWLDTIRKDKGKKKFQLRNTSRLIKDYPYFDGLKTGFYSEAGFCIVATAIKDGRRLIAVSLGSQKWRNRDKLVADLVTWGFDQIEYTDSLSHTTFIDSTRLAKNEN
ncbi:MAG: D-alanyl-D-alanine carboxypeptidase [Candidatus Delongbacteria bacterium]|nr:D-alanyl-D-alanine carboxypeptidase [Candidatus Delongbacteria bacterium]MBN2834263.1 D-alanyl-D-alanine carboxypeptidase [Candidatus Delongbacteria bacterium]